MYGSKAIGESLSFTISRDDSKTFLQAKLDYITVLNTTGCCRVSKTEVTDESIMGHVLNFIKFI